jgi:murein DD-endopeptidase MepM/ murein hydrolase activator NlpD
MSLKLSYIIRYIIIILLLSLSVKFFFSGFYKLAIEETKGTIDINVENKKKIKEVLNKLKTIKSEENIKKIDDIKLIKNEIIIKIKKDDTLNNILSPYFINRKIKNLIINEIGKEIKLKNLKINQKLFLYKNLNGVISKIIIPLNFSTDLVIDIFKDNVSGKKLKLDILKEYESKKFIIKSSIYKDGKDAQVPLTILSNAIRLYSYDIDFQREIRKGDEFEILYEVFYNKQRKSILFGEIKYINLILQKQKNEFFHFKTNEGYDYFDREGKNIQRSILKTPLDGAKISSPYGKRTHPISGYTKMHKGVDFAAPKGTPVFAGGNGVIEFVGRNGGYGKYIRIKHNSQYKTAYAHLNSYIKNLHKGQRVNQGEIIGFVGSTGKSTGPHLHYEIIYLGKQINPKQLKLLPTKKLKDEELKTYKNEINKLYSNFLFYIYE